MHELNKICRKVDTFQVRVTKENRNGSKPGSLFIWWAVEHNLENVVGNVESCIKVYDNVTPLDAGA